jgi:hypothetical protein
MVNGMSWLSAGSGYNKRGKKAKWDKFQEIVTNTGSMAKTIKMG